MSLLDKIKSSPDVQFNTGLKEVGEADGDDLIKSIAVIDANAVKLLGNTGLLILENLNNSLKLS